MDLIQLPPHSLRAGQVLTFSLRDAEGKLLVASGQTLPNTPQIQALLARPIWVLAHETKEYQRALAHKMDTMMHQGANLGDIVKVQADYKPDRAQRLDLGEQAAWADLQMHAHSLLRDPHTEDFRGRFQQLHNDAVARLAHRPDAILMFLIFDASQGFERYSARHALLCLALAEQCALKLGWSDDWRLALTQAALSMNISISAQQDRLAAQSEGPSHSQQQALISHGDRSAQLLADLGAKSELWLKTVCLHHDAGPGSLSGRAPAEQLARLLRRIDIFASRISPRGSRKAQPGAMAARAVFLDELKQADEAGAAIVKTVGLYPLGSLVRLVNGEVGIVFKRGHSATEPMVASLLGKSGNPLSEPVARDTRLATQAIAASLAPHELKLRVSMEKLLKMS